MLCGAELERSARKGRNWRHRAKRACRFDISGLEGRQLGLRAAIPLVVLMVVVCQHSLGTLRGVSDIVEHRQHNAAHRQRGEESQSEDRSEGVHYGQYSVPNAGGSGMVYATTKSS